MLQLSPAATNPDPPCARDYEMVQGGPRHVLRPVRRLDFLLPCRTPPDSYPGQPPWLKRLALAFACSLSSGDNRGEWFDSRDSSELHKQECTDNVKHTTSGEH